MSDDVEIRAIPGVGPITRELWDDIILWPDGEKPAWESLPIVQSDCRPRIRVEDRSDAR